MHVKMLFKFCTLIIFLHSIIASNNDLRKPLIVDHERFTTLKNDAFELPQVKGGKG